MSNKSLIAADAIFLTLYIGLIGAVLCLSLALLSHVAFDVDFGLLNAGAAAVNLAGWLLVPFGPALYSRLTGQPFSWRGNIATDGKLEF